MHILFYDVSYRQLFIILRIIGPIRRPITSCKAGIDVGVVTDTTQGIIPRTFCEVLSDRVHVDICKDVGFVYNRLLPGDIAFKL